MFVVGYFFQNCIFKKLQIMHSQAAKQMFSNYFFWQAEGKKYSLVLVKSFVIF